MTKFKQMIETARRNIADYKLYDGFDSAYVRRLIIDKIGDVKLPEKSLPGTYKELGEEEKIKISYLVKCAALGSDVCTELLKKSFTAEKGCYHEFMLAGAAMIGSEIGMEYGRTLYPELRNMRELGITHEISANEPEIQIGSYGFTVHHYETSYELGAAKLLPHPPQFEIFYDDVNERHIEQYSFSSWEQADMAHRKWELFIDGKDPAPVKYGFEVINDPQEGRIVDAIIPFSEGMVGEKSICDNGLEKEIKIFETLEKALEANRKILNSIQKESMPEVPAQKTKKEVPQPTPAKKAKSISPPTPTPRTRKKTKEVLEK